MSTQNGKCPICDDIANAISPAGFNTVCSCRRCGEYQIFRNAEINFQGINNQENKRRLYGWVRDQNRIGNTPYIDVETLEKVISRRPPPVAERAERILLEALHNESSLGLNYDVFDPRFVAASYSLDENDFRFLISVQQEVQNAEILNNHVQFRILPRGYVRYDELTRAINDNSRNGFVAMWFHDEMTECFTDGISIGIEQAGYNPIRVDNVEHINKIDDEIIAQINSSKFVVADFSGHRGGVYFEAGYAMGKGIPVFWTCHKDHLEELHFDIRQYNCIVWEDPKDLAVRLQNRIEAVSGKGIV